MKGLKDSEYEECIVTFFDILGFRAMLKSRSAGEISQALSLFRNISQEEEDHFGSLSIGTREISSVHAEIISDAVVRSRTTKTQHKDGALFGSYCHSFTSKSIALMPDF